MHEQADIEQRLAWLAANIVDDDDDTVNTSIQDVCKSWQKEYTLSPAAVQSVNRILGIESNKEAPLSPPPVLVQTARTAGGKPQKLVVELPNLSWTSPVKRAKFTPVCVALQSQQIPCHVNVSFRQPLLRIQHYVPAHDTQRPIVMEMDHLPNAFFSVALKRTRTLFEACHVSHVHILRFTTAASDHASAIISAFMQAVSACPSDDTLVWFATTIGQSKTSYHADYFHLQLKTEWFMPDQLSSITPSIVVFRGIRHNSILTPMPKQQQEQELRLDTALSIVADRPNHQPTAASVVYRMCVAAAASSSVRSLGPLSERFCVRHPDGAKCLDRSSLPPSVCAEDISSMDEREFQFYCPTCQRPYRAIVSKWHLARGCHLHGIVYGTDEEQSVHNRLLQMQYDFTRDKRLDETMVCTFWLNTHKTAIHVDNDDTILTPGECITHETKRIVRIHLAQDLHAMTRILINYPPPTQTETCLWIGIGRAYDDGYQRAWLQDACRSERMISDGVSCLVCFF